MSYVASDIEFLTCDAVGQRWNVEMIEGQERRIVTGTNNGYANPVIQSEVGRISGKFVYAEERGWVSEKVHVLNS